MKFFNKYYEDVCKKRQKELKQIWLEGTKVCYNVQDIIDEALKINKKI